MGAALTCARRYALFMLVGIAGEDDLDAPDLPFRRRGRPRKTARRQRKLARMVRCRQPTRKRSITLERARTTPPVGGVLSGGASAILRDQLLAGLEGLPLMGSETDGGREGMRSEFAWMFPLAGYVHPAPTAHPKRHRTGVSLVANFESASSIVLMNNDVLHRRSERHTLKRTLKFKRVLRPRCHSSAKPCGCERPGVAVALVGQQPNYTGAVRQF